MQYTPDYYDRYEELAWKRRKELARLERNENRSTLEAAERAWARKGGE